MVKAGDTVSMPSWVNVKKIGDEYKVRANTPLRLVTPQGRKHSIDAKELAKVTVSIKAK
jgi:hypothetical protein